MKIPYKTCRLLILLGHFLRKGLQKYQKSIRFVRKSWWRLRLYKTPKSIGKTTFWSIQKRWSKYLIKPVVYWDIWGPFREMAPKSIKIPLGFSLFREWVSTHSGNLINTVENWWFWHPSFSLQGCSRGVDHLEKAVWREWPSGGPQKQPEFFLDRYFPDRFISLGTKKRFICFS